MEYRTILAYKTGVVDCVFAKIFCVLFMLVKGIKFKNGTKIAKVSKQIY